MTTTQDFQTQADQHYASRFEEIGRLLKLREECDDKGHYSWSEAIGAQLEEMPLCVQLETVNPMREECEWSILLGTGGPADRVLVTTDYAGNVEDATYQFQDWFQPWTDARGQDDDAVKAFAEVFYFGIVELMIDGRQS